MQDNIDIFDADELVPDYPELQHLALSLLDENILALDSSTGRDEWTPRSTLSLDLNELLAGDTGEVVLASDDQMSLRSSSFVNEAGIVEQHVTAEGQDVSGFAFMSFDTGVTVYYPSGADLILDTIVS